MTRACRKIPGWLCTEAEGHAGGCGASEAALHHPLIEWMRRNSRQFSTEAIVEYQALVVENLFLEPNDPLHPTGRCTCTGESRCEWCQRICRRCHGDGLEPGAPAGSVLVGHTLASGERQVSWESPEARKDDSAVDQSFFEHESVEGDGC